MQQQVSLHAINPYVLRVNLGRDMPESDVRSALASGEMGFLHSFTTGSTVDGPGVRVVAWTTGCPWRCLYCHNPDTWSMSNGIPVTLTRATQELAKYRHGLKMMSGGFTLSGGEPLLQDRFAVKLLAAAKGMGIHTALDTTGYLGSRLDDGELRHVDLVLLDIKAWNPDRHRVLTGKEIDPVLKFAMRLSALGKPVWLRFVLVPGWTDDPDDITGIARFAASLQIVQRVDVLPFHQMGLYKWNELRIPYQLESVAPPSAELVARVCTQFRAEGLKAH
jgi:pyruvate formate lyase activating enzyme